MYWPCDAISEFSTSQHSVFASLCGQWFVWAILPKLWWISCLTTVNCNDRDLWPASYFEMMVNYTSNVNYRHRGPKRKRSFVCRYVAPPGECYYNTLICCDYFSSSSVVSCTFSVLCLYSKFGHHPHPLGYLCAKFHFFHGPHCWASPGEKLRTQSHNQSLTQLIWCPVM